MKKLKAIFPIRWSKLPWNTLEDWMDRVFRFSATSHLSHRIFLGILVQDWFIEVISPGQAVRFHSTWKLASCTGEQWTSKPPRINFHRKRRGSSVTCCLLGSGETDNHHQSSSWHLTRSRYISLVQAFAQKPEERTIVVQWHSGNFESCSANSAILWHWSSV